MNNFVDLHPPEWVRTKKHNPIVKASPELAHILNVWLETPMPPLQSRKQAWRILRRTLNLPAKAEPKTIRHSMATLLRSRGVHKEYTETQLGHAFGSSTTERYAKYDPNYLGNLPRALSKLFREILVASDKWCAVHLLSKVGNEKRQIVKKPQNSGAAYRTRTCDPRITNAMLYQLS